MRYALLVLSFVVSSRSLAAGWRAGVGRVDMTPNEPVWLSGYAARSAPSEGVLGPIEAKALALEDDAGERLLVITCDLLTMPRELAEPVARRLASRFALARARVLLCASHSHSAPVIEDRLVVMYFLDDARREQVKRYTATVGEALFEAGRQALESLAAAAVSTGNGAAGFAINRRQRFPDDPVDHDVPVIRVDWPAPPNGAPRRALLFAYACHNTTLSGPHICGDYAGFAQAALEERHTATIALFAAGCAGDQNPDPRRTIELAREHGAALADAVDRVLEGPMAPVSGSTSAAFGRTPLALVPAPSREELLRDAANPDRWIRGRAERLLARLDRGESIPESHPWTAQVWSLGDSRIIVALAGEVVVEYALRLKREVPLVERRPQGVIALAYANDVPAYIPSEKVLREGGYEGETSMRYYDFHGPWAPGIEERIVGHVLGLVSDARRPGPMREVGAQLVELWGEGEFTEGPVVADDGAIWFSDIPNDRILRIADGNVTAPHAPSGKANGLAFDGEGRLVACEGADGGGRRVVRYEKDGTLTVLAEHHERRRFNSPNDLTIDARGTIWFSDPRYAGDQPRELDHESVWRIDAPGEVSLAIDDVEKPNGLAFSPDGATLYVSDAGAAKLWAYRIDGDARPVRERLVFDFAPGRGVDGMEVDGDGNIWAAAGRGSQSGIWAIAPDGTLLDFIATPAMATNCAFGADGRTLIVTAGRSLYRIRTAVHGLRVRSGR